MGIDSSSRPAAFGSPSLSSESDATEHFEDIELHNCVRRSGRTTQWSKDEDDTLLRLVEKYGQQKWSVVASYLPDRKGKQCRERWHNHLRRDIKKGDWSAEEEKLLVEAHRALGNRWAEIARCMSGRSENAVKNHFNATLRRKERAAGGRKKGEASRPGVLRVYLKDQGLATASQENSAEKASGASADAAEDLAETDGAQSEGAEVNSPPTACPQSPRCSISLNMSVDSIIASTSAKAEVPAPAAAPSESCDAVEPSPSTREQDDAEIERTPAVDFFASQSNIGTRNYSLPSAVYPINAYSDLLGFSRLRLAALQIQPCASAFTVVPSCNPICDNKLSYIPLRPAPLNTSLSLAAAKYSFLQASPSLVW
ncbi:hypothetical protein CYMTET_12556 [Cymbomonas tetramitiformis]|uniref:Uncharacterized protein n=1 Tax=Cymbomonas tetramitiformis TaxID=36881 RepID=A0AAE0GK70_9CHLO|nr:hypothetical protein CYMTET_12556 [Cymbomonas tetramitiformis]